MNKLLIFLLFTSLIQAKINIGIGINTTHLKSSSKDYDYVEDSNLIAIQYENKNKIVSLSSFTNSFGHSSQMLLAGCKLDKNNKGWYSTASIGIVKGYNRIEVLPSKSDVKNIAHEFYLPNVLYKDYGFVSTVSVGYKFNPYVELEVNLFGNCTETIIKYLF